MDFFFRTLGALLRTQHLSRDDSVLVICGGSYDASVLRSAGFTRVTISNLDERYDAACRPFEWSKQDAEALAFPDGSFDWAMVHAGLHHCASPHRGLLEMCRVARKGVLVLEARDSALLRLAVRLGLTREYEIEAVAHNGCTMGGVRNSAIPNFIYRWTEREVFKTVESAFASTENSIHFFYGLRLPLDRLLMGSLYKRALAACLGALAVMLQRVFARQCNQFAFAIIRSGTWKSWISDCGTTLREEYARDLNIERYASRSRGGQRPLM